MKLYTGLILLLGLLVLTAAAADTQEEKDPDPTFQPGAEVIIELTIKAPKGWQLNYMLPVQAIFDQELLKKAPFTPVQSTLTFKLKEYAKEMVVSIPVKLKKSAKPGELEVPFSLDYSICNIETEECTFNVFDTKVAVEVESSAPAGSKNRALATGALEATVQLPPGPV